MQDHLDDQTTGHVPTRATRRRLRRAPFAAIAISVALSGVAAVIGIDIALEHGAFTYRDLKITNKDLTVREGELDAQLQDRERPEALEQAAKKLGMVENTSPYYLLVPSGRVIAPPSPSASPYPVPSGRHTPGQVVVGTKPTPPKHAPRPTPSPAPHRLSSQRSR